MSDNKRPRFGNSTESTESQEDDDDNGQFIVELNSMLKIQRSSARAGASREVMEKEDVVMASETSVSRIVESIEAETNTTAVRIWNFMPLNFDDTYFPFSRDFKFATDEQFGRTPTLYDYLVNSDTATQYSPARSGEELQKKFAEIQGVGRFYYKVPWIQLFNSNHILPFKNKLAVPSYEEPNQVVLMNLQIGARLTDKEAWTEFANPSRLSRKVLDFRRTVVFTDVVSFLLLVLDRCDNQIIIDTVKDYAKIVKEVYGENLRLIDEELSYVYGGAMSFFSVLSNGKETIGTLVDRYTNNLAIDEAKRLVNFLVRAALVVNDYDTRVGFISEPSYDSEIDQRLSDVDVYLKTFKSIAGLNDVVDTNYYRDFAKGFDQFIEEYMRDAASRNITTYELIEKIEKFKLSKATMLGFVADATRRFANALANAINRQTTQEEKEAVDEVLDIKNRVNALTNLSKDLLLAIKPYNMEIGKFGTEIRSLLLEMRRIYVTQKDEIKMWKDMYEKLKKDKNIQSTATKTGVSKSSELSVNARNYLGLLIREFLRKNPLMNMVYNIGGTAQLKDISNYLNINLSSYLLEELCISRPTIKDDWQEIVDLQIENFGDKPSTTRLMAFFDVPDTHKDELMMNTAQVLLSAPVYKAFMETFQYVELLHRKTRAPMSLSTLVSEDFKGVALEMASMIAAIMTKEQDTQKQHATTRFDKPGINVNLVNAKLSVRRKMELHLGCNFSGLSRAELII